MSHPTPEERREQQERRKRNEAERNARTAREAATYDNVQKLVKTALKRPRDLIDLDVILTDLSEARAIALSCYPHKSARS